MNSQIKQLEEHRAALGEQLEFQRSLLSAQPRERDRHACWPPTNTRTEEGANEKGRRLLAEDLPALDDLQSEVVARLRADGIAEVEFASLFSTDSWKEVAAEAATYAREVERTRAVDREQPRQTPARSAHS